MEVEGLCGIGVWLVLVLGGFFGLGLVCLVWFFWGLVVCLVWCFVLF